MKELTEYQENRVKALNQWKNTSFEEKFYRVIAWLKSKGEDVTSRHPHDLTGREIQECIEFYNSTQNKSFSTHQVIKLSDLQPCFTGSFEECEDYKNSCMYSNAYVISPL
jgi:DNA-binding transcriptional regulator GbsR (MarR family)